MSTPATATLTLLPFTDLDLEISGWYAIGHHDPVTFFASVVQQDPDSIFLYSSIKLAWGKVRPRGFDLLTRPLPGFEPMTVIERLSNIEEIRHAD